MRRYRGIRFALQTDLLNGVVAARRKLEEAKGAMKQTADFTKKYYFSNPDDKSILETAKILEEAAKKAELARMLVIQATAMIKEF